MKIIGIFDNNEQAVGNRLSGMKTFLAKTEKQILEILDELENDHDVGIIVFNERTYDMVKPRIDEIKKNNLPLVIKL